MAVGQNLDFDMARLFQIFFEIEATVTESVGGFRCRVAPGGGEIGIAGDEAHTFSASTGYGFEKNGIAHGVRQSLSFFRFLNGIVGARDSGNVGAAGELATSGFRAERFHGLGRGTDEDKIGVFAGAGEGGIFGAEAITRMNGVATGAARDVDQLIDAQIAFARGCGADGISFVGEANVQRGAVGFAEDGDGRDAEFAAGSDNANGDFAAIGD